MTSQLQPREVELFRCLKKAAIVLMLLFRMDKPVGESEIASILDIHPQTIRTYLESLARLGVVTRTHRYQGWMLTGGGRQMILGQSTGQIHAEPTRKIKTSAKKPRSNAKISRSLPLAAASLSLSFKEESNTVAAAATGASAKKSRSSARISRSHFSKKKHMHKKGDRTTLGSARSDPMVQANLEAFASIGLARNDFVLEICQMDHVTPDYILGQVKRLQAERRYSRGLLLTVIRSNDYLPEKYLAPEGPEPQPQIIENGQELEEEPEAIQEIEPDPSIYAPLSKSGMTAAQAWSAMLCQLKVDMPKAAYDKWIQHSVLVSAKDGIFVIGAHDGHARDWLENRLSSTAIRQLTGICNRIVDLKFVDLNDYNS